MNQNAPSFHPSEHHRITVTNMPVLGTVRQHWYHCKREALQFPYRPSYQQYTKDSSGHICKGITEQSKNHSSELQFPQPCVNIGEGSIGSKVCLKFIPHQVLCRPTGLPGLRHHRKSEAESTLMLPQPLLLPTQSEPDLPSQYLTVTIRSTVSELW